MPYISILIRLLRDPPVNLILILFHRHPMRQLGTPRPNGTHAATPPQIRRINTTIPPRFLNLMLNVCLRPMGRDCVFVLVDQKRRIVAEESVDVFEGSICCFGVEDVDQRYEGGVEDYPDDVEAPA